ncbi:MAG: CFI-box-CTERM domain-containing protein [Myxococcaceae bacterium]
MTLDEFRAKAKARQQQLASQPNDGLDAFQRDALAFFSRVPEPPLYRRRDDPAKALAATLVEEAELLVARAWRLGREVEAFAPAIEAHVASLVLIAEGKVEAAEPLWHEALQHERAATAPLRLFKRTDDQRGPVFDAATQRSRFDPTPEAGLEVRLACPSCHKVSPFSLSTRVAMHELQCTKCSALFSAYVGEVRSLTLTQLAKNRRRYSFHLEELSGLHSRVEFDDSNIGELAVSRRDLLACLYEHGQLRGVLNLNTSRVLWVSAPGPCFVATVAFGEGAPELHVLRGFRDRVLMPRATGRALVALYYEHGPALARLVGERPVLRRAARSTLQAIIPLVERL